MTSIRVGSGHRKYMPIWQEIKAKGKCIIECPREDTFTVINGVKKEKYEDKNKLEKKQLICTPTKTGVHFRLINEISINNL